MTEPDRLEFDYAMDAALDDVLRLIADVRSQLDSAEKAAHDMRAEHEEGNRVVMRVNAGGVVQGLGNQLDRHVGQLHVLTLAQQWR